jgi:hypothetical protein
MMRKSLNMITGDSISIGVGEDAACAKLIAWESSSNIGRQVDMTPSEAARVARYLLDAAVASAGRAGWSATDLAELSALRDYAVKVTE